MTRHDELTLEQRTQSELCDRVEELAASYTPEWRFDRRDADVGSALALIYTGQMAENIRRLNQLPEKYHTEFANLMGLTLKPAYPASGVAVVELMRGTVPGVALPRGTRLTADGTDGAPILFETMGDVYLTNARITDVVSLSGTRGHIVPILGGPKPADLVPQPSEPVEPTGSSADEGTEPSPEGERSVPPFALFDYEEAGIEKNALLLYHQSLFAGDGGVPIQIALTSPEGKSLATGLCDPSAWRWSYYTAEGLRPFEHVSEQDGTVLLCRENGSEPLRLDGADYHLICLEALGPVNEAVIVGDIRAASTGEAAEPEMIIHNGEPLEAVACMPFGETVSLFDECYLCDDAVFAQQGAEIRLSFQLESRRRLIRLTPQQESAELKVIKRKPRGTQYDVAFTSPERVALEYFNGRVWQRLPCSNEWSTLFDGRQKGEYEISFLCPDDWASVPINGYEGRSLRLRVTQADNCYLLPCEHMMPLLRNVRLSYAYTGQWKQPQRVRTVCGTMTADQTRALLAGESITAFAPLPYPEASLYLGFDRPLEGAPISMLFDVEENIHFRMEPVQYQYSTRTGFRAMKVIDGTNSFAGAGTVLFMPTSDFAPMEVEGVKKWWLRICGGKNAAQGYHALVRGIRLNAVNIRNQQTLGEERFYVETVTPNMTLPLSARNILSAEVFVSELGQHSRRQIRELLEQRPQDVRVEYDLLGEVTAFFVRWTEVDTFDRSHPGDRHYMIDRVRSCLVFGDGVHVRIPQAQHGTAVLVYAVSCDGARGNVPVGAVNSFFGNVMYVQSVFNPAATSAGIDLEDLDSARRRGVELLSSRGRLVSEQDFVRAVRSFSGAVKKVKCLTGRSLDGESDPATVTVAVMTDDYREGAYAFNNIREALRRELLDRCEATIAPEELVLAEPLYVEISVSVWAKADDAARAFDVQDLILESVQDFLDPIAGAGHSGWEIGTLPTDGQLKMLLQSLRFAGRMSRMIAVARYIDRAGTHETTLDELPDMPFAIGVNGKHHVYIEFQ